VTTRIDPAAAVLLLFAAAASGCGAGSAEEATGDAAPTPNALTAEQTADGWRLLFDGQTTDGWRGYGRSDMPDGWQVVDGALTRVAPAGDIITEDTFRDFELALEWSVEPGGNSGIFHRAIEGDGPIYMFAPEMQILDDEAHPDGGSRLTAAGADYGLYPAPAGVVRPAGEWNAVRIRVEGNQVTYWLNDQRIVDYELHSPDWEARVAASKFAEWPDFGRAPEGHIGLQDHGDRVAFRSIRILELP
jgi:hypothetical protein